MRTRRRIGPWLRFGLLLLVTAVLLVPVALPILRILVPYGGSGSEEGPLVGLIRSATTPPVTTWLTNSVLVTLATVLVTLAVAAPAGYVLSRAKGRLVHGYALVIFALQAVPIVLFLIPLFVLFAGLGLIDNLIGLTLVYLGLATAVATWTMSTYFDSIPVQLEEAAWLDGCSVLGGFLRVVLRNALPGVLATSVFTFLLAWNDYWMAVVFLRSDTNYTIGLALASAGGFPALSIIALVPPLVVFAALNRYFSLGGISGSLTGR